MTSSPAMPTRRSAPSHGWRCWSAQRMSRKRTVLVRWFLSGFQRIPIDDVVADLAVEIRRTHRMRLSDAIIWASARHVGGCSSPETRRTFRPTTPACGCPIR